MARLRYPYITIWLYTTVARAAIPAFVYMCGVTMFEHIPELNLIASIAAIAVLAWIVLVQYSKYTDHIKANRDNPDNLRLATEFAVFPYAVIPVMFGILAAIASLAITDWAVTRGYISTVTECLGASVILSIVIDCVLAKYLVNQVGNAVYFATIESKVASVAEGFPGSVEGLDEKDVKLLRILKALRED